MASSIAAVMALGCAMLWPRLITTWLTATASRSVFAASRCPSDQPGPVRSASVRTGMDPVICEYMVWIAGCMTRSAISIWPACRSASLRCQKMKASAFRMNTGLPFSVGPGARMKSSSL